MQIAGATPAQYDGVFNIIVTGANTFTYTMASCPASNAAGTMTAVLIPVSTVNSRTISAITYGGTGGLTATVTCTGHGYSSGQLIQISGAAQWQYDGIFTITSVPRQYVHLHDVGSPRRPTPRARMTAAAVSTMTYTGPIYITTTTTLRTEAIEVGYFTSYLDTATYIFMNAVINTPQIFTDDPTEPLLHVSTKSTSRTRTSTPTTIPRCGRGSTAADTDPHGDSSTTPGQSDDLQYAPTMGWIPRWWTIRTTPARSSATCRPSPRSRS